MATPALRRSTRAIWRDYLAGRPREVARLMEALGPEWTPAWREALARSFDMLDGWRELVGRSDEAARRVVDALADAVERGRDTLAVAPDHPRRSVLARDLTDFAALPTPLFVSLVPSILAQIAKERPEAAPDLRNLRGAVVRLIDEAGGDAAGEDTAGEDTAGGDTAVFRPLDVPTVVDPGLSLGVASDPGDNPGVEEAFGPDDETEDVAAATNLARLDAQPPPDAQAPPDTEVEREEAPADEAHEATLLSTDGLDALHLATIRSLVLGRWEEVLSTWANAWERERVDRILGDIAVTLIRKGETIRRLRRLLGVELDYLSVRGDWGEGVWQASNWDALERYAAMAESNPAIRRLAAMLGRLEAERARSEALTPPPPPPPVPRATHRRGSLEFRGVHYSADIGRLTSGEFGLLATPELEYLFFMKLLDGRLLTYEQGGEDVYTSASAVVRAPPARPQAQRGPIILCIDTSASMSGEPELVAKTMALAMLRIALKERRACWAISYSHTSDLKEQDLTRMPEALGELVRFLSMSFRGGTDPVPALQAAIRRLETIQFDRADVLWITDGRFTVPEGFTRSVRALRETRNFRIHMLLVAPAEVPEIVDNCWEWREGRSFDAGALELLSRV